MAKVKVQRKLYPVLAGEVGVTNSNYPYTNVLRYGANGDGVTDNTIAFNNAVALLKIIGGTLQIPKPAVAYYFTSATRVDLNAALFPVTVEGEQSKLRFGPGTNARPFVIRNSVLGTTVKGLIFESVNGLVSCNCLDIMNCSNVLIEDNTFKDSTFYGLGVYEDTIGGTATACDNVVIRNNVFINIGVNAIEQFPKVKSNLTEIYGNKFFSCGANPRGFVATPACAKPGQAYNNAKIYNNIIYDAPAIGFALGNIETMEVHHNEFYNCDSYAIALTIAPHGAPVDYTAEFKMTSIHDNTFVCRTGFVTNDDFIVVNGFDITPAGPVLIERNKFFGGGANGRIFAVEPVANVNNLGATFSRIRFAHNEAYDCLCADQIKLTNGNGGVPVSPEVYGNTFINNDLTKAALRLNFTGCSNPKVYRNRMRSFGANAILFTNNTGIIIVEDNEVDGYNVTNAAAVAAFAIVDAVANSYKFRRNRVLTGLGNPKSILSASSATPLIWMEGNTAEDVSVTVLTNSTPNIQVSSAAFFEQYGKYRRFYGTTFPVAGGVYLGGDVLVCVLPSLANPVREYVCTSGGSPGTWRPVSWLVSKNTTVNRPVLTASDVGVTYLDTTLDADGKLIVWNGVGWFDMTGAPA